MTAARLLGPGFRFDQGADARWFELAPDSGDAVPPRVGSGRQRAVDVELAQHVLHVSRTVFGDRNSRVAISSRLSPSTMQPSTSCSRFVRPASASADIAGLARLGEDPDDRAQQSGRQVNVSPCHRPDCPEQLGCAGVLRQPAGCAVLQGAGHVLEMRVRADQEDPGAVPRPAQAGTGVDPLHEPRELLTIATSGRSSATTRSSSAGEDSAGRTRRSASLSKRLVSASANTRSPSATTTVNMR